MHFFSVQESLPGVECSPSLALADIEYSLYEFKNDELLGYRFYWDV